MREGLLLPDHPVTPCDLRINPFAATQRELAGLKVKKPKNLGPAPIQAAQTVKTDHPAKAENGDADRCTEIKMGNAT